MPGPKRPLTEAQVLALLRRLEEGWPENLMLFGGPHTLTLLRKREHFAARVLGETIPREAIVARFRIPADGGDPNWGDE